ncbi:MAG: hypothetical protein A3C35_01980 [Omnitrophica bacterium RIFCSPHIGHO2_02_FULL_46_11]|nr:MAG: hypothetical protein A3C35_01980 [Omnitrophica bacterium RIFCSPHIGHO2_02_FULL_46_11]
MMLVGKSLAEMIGTFAVIFVGGSSILLAERFPNIFPSFGVAATFGLMITLMILAFGYLSGAHFNPAVTLAFAVAGRFPASEVLFYWLGQSAGGLFAAGLLIMLRRI